MLEQKGGIGDIPLPTPLMKTTVESVTAMVMMYGIFLEVVVVVLDLLVLLKEDGWMLNF